MGLTTESQLADLEASVTVLRVHSPGRALCPFIGTHRGAECYWHLYRLHTVPLGKEITKTVEKKCTQQQKLRRWSVELAELFRASKSECLSFCFQVCSSSSLPLHPRIKRC